MKYLIVDDSPGIRKLIRQEVCQENDTIKECSDGKEALPAYEEFLPDYVLMDIRMANISGITAAKQLHDKYPGARILIITNYDTPSFRSAARKVGALAFFSKENLCEVKKYISQYQETLIK